MSIKLLGDEKSVLWEDGNKNWPALVESTKFLPKEIKNSCLNSLTV
jgi:hypothetical protein